MGGQRERVRGEYMFSSLMNLFSMYLPPVSLFLLDLFK